jgi:hypothetical protein
MESNGRKTMRGFYPDKCQGKPRKDGAQPALFLVVVCCSMYFLCCSMYFCVLRIVCFVTFPVLFVCICVPNNCHQVATQLQLNIYIYQISNITSHFMFLYTRWTIRGSIPGCGEILFPSPKGPSQLSGPPSPPLRRCRR